MGSDEAPTLAGVMRNNIRRRREELNWNQGDLAEAMSGMGWTPTTVTWVETGRRHLRADELIQLCVVLGVRPDYFLEGEGLVRINEQQFARPLDAMRALLNAPAAPSRMESSGSVVRDEERKAAAKLGMSVTVLRTIAPEVWDGRSLLEERERRLGSTKNVALRSLQARRGRITRDLIEELRTRFDVSPSGRVVTSKSATKRKNP